MPLRWGVVYSLWMAILCDVVLELSLRGYGPWAPGPGVVIGLLFTWCLLLFLVGLTGRLRTAFAILLVVSGAVAAATRAKLSILAEPVVPADLAFVRSPGFLLAMVDGRSVVLGVAILTAVAWGVLWLGRVLGRRFEPIRRGDDRWRPWVTMRIALVLVCGALLVHAEGFNRPPNAWRAVYDSVVDEWANWGQVQNYQENGFIGGFLYNLPTEAMAEPRGYGPEEMREIAERYTERAARFNQQAGAGSLGGYNIVLVLSESFGDPTRLEGLELGEDPIPRTRETSDSEWGGQSLAAFYGNGTSTMEFQALTGQADALFEPQVTTPFQQVIPGMDDYPSAVGWLKGQGYRAVAIHAFSTELYNRRQVYPTLGFDDFVYDATMTEQDKIDDNEFIADTSAYSEVLHQLQKSDAPLLAHLVTMQNHGPYDDAYADPVPVQGVDDDEARRVGEYARGLSHTDTALPGFLDDLRATGEPTVVVFFGDHFPGVFSTDTQSANTDVGLRSNPLFIWSTEGSERRSLGVTNPIDFLPLAMQRIGAPLPPYYELLREVREEVGAVDRRGVVGADGTVTPYSELDARQTQLVRDLRMVQYDFSVGQRYALGQLWYSPTDELEER